MIVGIPSEIGDNEFRVAAVPAGVATLVGDGHQVVVERRAGIGSGIEDAAFADAGARIVASHREVFESADLLLKVRGPRRSEWPFCRPDQILFAFLYLVADPDLTAALVDRGGVCIACESVEDADGRLPLLAPMSEVAGRMAVQEGAKYLERPMMGRGVLLGGIPGVDPARVVVLGAGVAGTAASRVAAALGAHVTVLDIDADRLRRLVEAVPAVASTLTAAPAAVHDACCEADLVVGAAHRRDERAPTVLRRETLRAMSPGAVVVDVSVDQGGCVETTRPTTHSNPVFIEEGVVHYAVPNMPAAVARTSTPGLAAATLPVVRRLADLGWRAAARDDPGLASGVCIVHGTITGEAVARVFDLPSTPLTDLL